MNSQEFKQYLEDNLKHYIVEEGERKECPVNVTELPDNQFRVLLMMPNGEKMQDTEMEHADKQKIQWGWTRLFRHLPGVETEDKYGEITVKHYTKGLRISVYRNKYNGKEVDCTNNGISSKHDTLTLVGPGIPEIFEQDEEAPAVWMTETVPGHNVLKPYLPEKLTRHSMMGGNFGYTSDSRFPAEYPVGIHDRYE